MNQPSRTAGWTASSDDRTSASRSARIKPLSSANCGNPWRSTPRCGGASAEDSYQSSLRHAIEPVAGSKAEFIMRHCASQILFQCEHIHRAWLRLCSTARTVRRRYLARYSAVSASRSGSSRSVAASPMAIPTLPPACSACHSLRLRAARFESDVRLGRWSGFPRVRAGSRFVASRPPHVRLADARRSGGH